MASAGLRKRYFNTPNDYYRESAVWEWSNNVGGGQRGSRRTGRWDHRRAHGAGSVAGAGSIEVCHKVLAGRMNL